jgi:lysophospholipase L1-like esterase
MAEVVSRDPRKAILFRFLGVLTLIGFPLICGEIFVRLSFPYYTPDTVRKHSLPYVQAVYTSLMLAPVNDQFKSNRGKDEKVTYFINEHGTRGASFKLPKPTGVQRIVVLGGSTVFDTDADEGADWPHLVEKFLREKGHRQVEVINAGIPGLTSTDSLGRLYTEIWQWEPDYLIMYEAWNDIKYFNRLSYDMPLIRLVKPSNLDADPYKNYQGMLDYLLSYSQLYMRVRTKYFAWKYPVGSEGKLREERKDNVEDLGLAQFRLNMETFVDVSRNIHAIPILITQATLVSPTNTAEDRKRIGYGYVGLSHEGIVRAYEKCRQLILETAQEKKADVLDLMSQFQGKSEVFRDHDHTTPHGSEAVAKRVADFLAPLLKRSLE